MRNVAKFGMLVSLLLGNSLFAHTALMSCFDNGDNTVTCEGGYSDGSSATGVACKVMQNGKVVHSMKFDANSEVTFKKPAGEYVVVFDGGEGHTIEIKSQKILN